MNLPYLLEEYQELGTITPGNDKMYVLKTPETSGTNAIRTDFHNNILRTGSVPREIMKPDEKIKPNQHTR